jgi:predicted XRE-type DNA-binding protein
MPNDSATPRRVAKVTRSAASKVEASSGNVFRDLGISNPEVVLAKAEIVQRIRALIAERKLTQAKAGELLGLDQPKVSALVRGRVSGYSLERLFRILNALGQQVEIGIHAAPSRNSGEGACGILVRG